MPEKETKEERNARQKARVDLQRAAGLCHYPGCRNPPNDGRVKCEVHLRMASKHSTNSWYRGKKFL